MKEYIKNSIENGGFTYGFIKEANISLNYLKDIGEDITETIDIYRNVIAICEVIDRFDEPQFIEDINNAINTLKNYIDNGAITPLSLKDDEFESQSKWFRGNEYYINKRCNYIKKSFGICYNFDAYKLNIIRDYYINKEGNFIIHTDRIIKNNPRLYLSKGGVIDGHYIENCSIKQNEVYIGNYVHKGAVRIECSRLCYSEDNCIYFTDIRNKKLTALRKFYDVIIHFDKNFKKIDIRNFNEKQYVVE